MFGSKQRTRKPKKIVFELTILYLVVSVVGTIIHNRCRIQQVCQCLFETVDVNHYLSLNFKFGIQNASGGVKL